MSDQVQLFRLKADLSGKAGDVLVLYQGEVLGFADLPQATLSETEALPGLDSHLSSPAESILTLLHKNRLGATAFWLSREIYGSTPTQSNRLRMSNTLRRMVQNGQLTISDPGRNCHKIYLLVQPQL